MRKLSTIPLEVLTGYKWSILAEVAQKAFTPFVFLVLARLLDPENFGIITFATLLISFAQILWDSGLSKTLIQSREDTDKAANVVFYHNLMLSLLIYGLLFLSAGTIAKIFEDPRLTDILRIQGLQIVAASVASVQVALLQRNMNFKSLFRVRIIALSLSGFLSIALAWIGWQYWALVAGILAGELIKAVILWKANPWRPSWQYDQSLSGRLWKVGGWILIEELLAWFIVWGDSAVVGYYLGSYELGLYRTGSLIVAMVLGTLMDPMVPVVFSSLARVQNDKLGFHAYLDRLLQFFITIALPTGACLLVLRQPIVDFILGQRWEGIQPVIACFAIATALSYTVSGLPAAFRAWGHAKGFATLRALSVCYIVPAYVVSIGFGLQSFLYSRIAVTVLTLIVYAVATRFVFQYSLIRFFKSYLFGLAWAAGLAGITPLTEYLMARQLLSGQRLLVVFMGFAAMVFYLFWMSRDRAFFRQFLQGLTRPT